MIPRSVVCRCGASVALVGGCHLVRSGGIERRYHWAGGVCGACGRLVQFGERGQSGDYQHCRWWFLGKEWEDSRGRARRWPGAWRCPQCGPRDRRGSPAGRPVLAVVSGRRWRPGMAGSGSAASAPAARVVSRSEQTEGGSPGGSND